MKTTRLDIDEKDMEIILDALEHYHECVRRGILQLTEDHPYNLDDIEGLFESLENS